MRKYARNIKQRIDGVRGDLLELRAAFSKNYWYHPPTGPAATLICEICGMEGQKHVKGKNGYECPIQSSHSTVATASAPQRLSGHKIACNVPNGPIGAAGCTCMQIDDSTG